METDQIHKPNEKVPENNLQELAEIVEENIDDAIDKWNDKPPLEEFDKILEANSRNSEP